MKIAITATENNLEADVDPRFGRASYFILVDSDTMKFEAIENLQNINAQQGAGIQAGKTIINNDVDVLITGNCGPKAFNILNSNNVKIAIGAKGKVKDALKEYQNNKLEIAENASVEGHWV
jgi:predicted Fe-Mo cluster-binding NifX family protein